MDKILSYAVLTVVLMFVMASSIAVYFSVSSSWVSTAEGAANRDSDAHIAAELSEWLRYNKSTISGSQVFELANAYKATDLSIAIKAVSSDKILVIGQPLKSATFDSRYLNAESHTERIQANFGQITNRVEDTSTMTNSTYLVNVESLYTTYLIKDSGNNYIGIYIVPVT